jgi:hypothetical protein
MSTPSTNKLLILNSILLVLILTVLLAINYSRLKNMIARNSDDIYETNNEDYPDIRYYPKMDSREVDFSGLKNDTISLPDEIIETITAELDAFNWNDEFQTENLVNLFHETVFAKQFSLNPKSPKRFIVITFSNHGGNLYHAARGVISLFEFQKEHKSWLITQKYIAFGYGTEYGLEPLWCKIVQIGSNNKYAVIVQTDYSGNGGHELQSQAVYSEVGCSFDLVFDFTNYEHYEDYLKDIEYTEGYSNMHFLKSDKAWFDIETKSEETEWNDKTPGAIKRFVFNGEEYVEAKRNFKVDTN